ncbi:MAG: hypothetical protein ACREAF_02745 [Nitrosopumilaceae archaeon]
MPSRPKHAPKPNPSDYYPIMFDNDTFSRIASNKKYSKIVGKDFATPKAGSKNIELESLGKLSDTHERNEIAAKLLLAVKRHYAVEEFRDNWNNRKIAPGSADYSHVVVYGNLEISNEKEFPFYVISENTGVTCKMKETPRFKNGRIAVLGEIKVSTSEQPRLYVDAAIVCIHRQDVG